MAAAYLCCLIALLQVQGRSHMDHSKVSYHGQPVYNNPPLPSPPLVRPAEIDTRFGAEKRLVPGGSNPLHN